MFYPRTLLLAAVMLCSSQLSALILLDEVMTRDEQYKTGVSKLNAKQKMELEKWLNAKFVLKNQADMPESREVTLEVNINNGKQLRMSDGSLFEIAPQDVPMTALWITPFKLTVSDSGDSTYPYLLQNMDSGTTVKAKMIEPPTS